MVLEVVLQLLLLQLLLLQLLLLQLLLQLGANLKQKQTVGGCELLICMVPMVLEVILVFLGVHWASSGTHPSGPYSAVVDYKLLTMTL